MSERGELASIRPGIALAELADAVQPVPSLRKGGCELVVDFTPLALRFVADGVAGTVGREAGPEC